MTKGKMYKISIHNGKIPAGKPAHLTHNWEFNLLSQGFPFSVIQLFKWSCTSSFKTVLSCVWLCKTFHLGQNFSVLDVFFKLK